MTAPERDKLLGVEQVAEMTTWETSTLYTRRMMKLRPHSFKLGGKVVYWRSEVLAFIAEAESEEEDR